MPISTRATRALGHGIADFAAGREIVAALNTASGEITPAAAVVPVVITYTTGNPAYTPTGAFLVANGGTPTVVELLKLVLELQANITSLQAVLHGHGLTT